MLGMLADAGFALAQLAGKFIHHFIDSSIEIGFGVLGKDVRSGQCEMNFDNVGFLFILVVKQNDVGGKNLLTVFLEVADLICNKGMDRPSESDIAGTQVDLHRYIMEHLRAVRQQKAEDWDKTKYSQIGEEERADYSPRRLCGRR